MFKLDLEKGEEPEVKLPTYVGLLKKQENPTSGSLTILKPLIAQIKTNGKILRRDGNNSPSNMPPEKSLCRTRSNS